MPTVKDLGSEMEDIPTGGGWWMRFENPGDAIIWVLQSIWYKEANGKYAEQVVASLSTPNWDMNVGMTHKKKLIDGRTSENDTTYASILKKLPIGHKVVITFTGYYDGEKTVMVNGKTKSGNNFAKNYSFQKSKLPDPSYNKMAPVTVDDFDTMPY